MSNTKQKGDIGEAMVLADAVRRGYKVAIPVGEDWRYDLIVLRNGGLERVQCKYTISDGAKIEVKCRSTNNWGTYKYTSEDVDWIACYDATTNKVYYVPASLLKYGKSLLTLRVTPTKNGQAKGVLWAKDFTEW